MAGRKDSQPAKKCESLPAARSSDALNNAGVLASNLLLHR
jgi:hypothetical protein